MAGAIAGMHLQNRLWMLLKQPWHLGRAGHGVPMAQVTANAEHQGIRVTGGFRQPKGQVALE